MWNTIPIIFIDVDFLFLMIEKVKQDRELRGPRGSGVQGKRAFKACTAAAKQAECIERPIICGIV